MCVYAYRICAIMIDTFFYNKLSNSNFPGSVPVKPKPNQCKSALHTSCLLEVALSRFSVVVLTT